MIWFFKQSHHQKKGNFFFFFEINVPPVHMPAIKKEWVLRKGGYLVRPTLKEVSQGGRAWEKKQQKENLGEVNRLSESTKRS